MTLDAILEVQSYGGGVQSVALAILNATGRVENPAKLAIFADPGDEEVETYSHLVLMAPWLMEHGVRLRYVRGQYGLGNHLDLYDYIVAKPTATVLPVHGDTGLYPRQCTKNWKVDAVLREMKKVADKPWEVQIGISWDEAHRMKDSPDKRIQHRFPLVDQRITREACRRIIIEAGFPVPPKSGCTFCPFQPQSRWQRRRAEQPKVFERAACLEDVLLQRMEVRGFSPVYLSGRGKPLREAFPPGQATMFPDNDEFYIGCDGGYCFT